MSRFESYQQKNLSDLKRCGECAFKVGQSIVILMMMAKRMMVEGIQSMKIVIMIITKEEHSKNENIDYNRRRIALKV